MSDRLVLPFSVRAPLTELVVATALELAAARSSLLVPTALVVVPLRLAADAALPRQADATLAELDEVQRRADTAGVAVDARVERGRTARQALVDGLRREPAARVVLGARAGEDAGGFEPEDVAWLLEHLAPEVVVLRAAMLGAPVD